MRSLKQNCLNEYVQIVHIIQIMLFVKTKLFEHVQIVHIIQIIYFVKTKLFEYV